MRTRVDSITSLLEKDSLTIVTFELGLTRWQLGCLILAARFRSGRLLCAFVDLERQYRCARLYARACERYIVRLHTHIYTRIASSTRGLVKLAIRRFIVLVPLQDKQTNRYGIILLLKLLFFDSIFLWSRDHKKTAKPMANLRFFKLVIYNVSLKIFH